MKKTIAVIITVGLLCLSCFILTGGATTPNNIDENEILDVISNEDFVSMNPDKYVNALTNITALSEEDSSVTPFSQRYNDAEVSAIVDEYTNSLHEYYTNSSWAIQAYSESFESALQSSIISDNIDAGNLSAEINSITPIDDNTMNVDATLVGWIKCVDQQEDKFVSFVIVNRDNIIYQMKKEDDTWKIASHLKYVKEFSPEDFNNGKATYDTYEEAYKGIADFPVENPF